MVNTLLVAFAFGAGMTAVLNPCGFATLIAYLSRYFLGENKSGLREGVKVGGLMTLGFITVFLSVGILLSLLGRWILGYVPAFIFLIGGILVIWGVMLLLGKKLSFQLPGLSFLNPTKTFYAYGVSYSIVSIGCTLPIFLAVVVQTLALASIIESAIALASYTAGFAVLMMGITIALSLAKKHTVEKLKGLLPHINAISGLILIVTGIYVIWYEAVYGIGIIAAV